jgi:hypothetical protein
LARQEHKIPPRLDFQEEGADRFSQQSFCTVPVHSIPYTPPRREGKTRNLQIIFVSDQHKKRVGIRPTKSPHPLEIIRIGQAEPALHLGYLEPLSRLNIPPNFRQQNQLMLSSSN